MAGRQSPGAFGSPPGRRTDRTLHRPGFGAQSPGYRTEAFRHPALSAESAEEPGSCFRRLPERYRALPVWHGAAALSGGAEQSARHPTDGRYTGEYPASRRRGYGHPDQFHDRLAGHRRSPPVKPSATDQNLDPAGQRTPAETAQKITDAVHHAAEVTLHSAVDVWSRRENAAGLQRDHFQRARS